MEKTPEADGAYSDYLMNLRQDLESLERFPRSSYAPLGVLAVSLTIVLASFAGLSLIPVPSYLLLPFVLVPASSLVHQERKWRQEHLNTTALIRLAEQKRAGPGSEHLEPD